MIESSVVPMLKWYAVYTRPCFEKRVSELLDNQGIENYCPMQKIVRRWSDRKKIVSEPVFRSYVFVRVDYSQQLVVRITRGVLDFVNFLKTPAIIPDQEIDTVKRFLSDYTNVKLESINFQTKDRVQVVSGPLMQMNGTVLKVRQRTVTVLLPSLGFSMTAEIDKENLINISA
jgi:transcription antitermination factor NusG